MPNSQRFVVASLSAVLWINLIVGGLSSSYDDFSDKGCNRAADIVFVLDESGSIWGPHFQNQLEFVEHVIDSFDVRPNKTTFGVMTFGDTERVIFNLGDYTTHSEISDVLKNVEQKRGETYTHSALRTMRTQMFARSLSRSWVPHVAIIITDGESNFPEETAREAMLAHREGIQLFAVGVGPFINEAELVAIAGTKDQVFQVDSYAVLETLRELLAWKTCQATTLPPTTTTPPPPPLIQGCTEYRPVDVIWAIPDWDGVEITNKALDFISDVTADMKLSPSQVQVGLTPRECSDGAAIKLKEKESLLDFDVALAKRRYSSEANTLKHIRYMSNKGMTFDSGSRQEAVKLGLLIIDSNHGSTFTPTLEAATSAKQSGLLFIVIGIGPRVIQSELKSIASTPEDVILTNSYDELDLVKPDVIARICYGMSSAAAESRSRRIYIKRYFNVYED